MAGSTTNIGLKKPTYSEDADVAIINENMDTLDSTISALDNGLAIVSNNNTHGAITAGQYVYVRNHGSLAEGMYTANSNIAANATLSSSNLTAASSGSLNKLNSDINTLNSKITTASIATGITGVDAYKAGNVVTLNIATNASISTTTAAWINIGTLPVDLRPSDIISFIVFDNSSAGNSRGNIALPARVRANGDVDVFLFANESAIPYGTVTYCV